MILSLVGNVGSVSPRFTLNHCSIILFLIWLLIFALRQLDNVNHEEHEADRRQGQGETREHQCGVDSLGQLIIPIIIWSWWYQSGRESGDVKCVDHQLRKRFEELLVRLQILEKLLQPGTVLTSIFVNDVAKSDWKLWKKIFRDLSVGLASRTLVTTKYFYPRACSSLGSKYYFVVVVLLLLRKLPGCK